MQKSKYLAVIPAALALGFLAPTFAQEQQERPATEAPQRDFVGPYLQQKATELAGQDRKLGAVGRSNIAEGILAVLIARDPLANKGVIGGARQDEVKTALLRTLANYLASVGKTPADLNTALRSGISPTEAAANVLFYRPDSAQEYWAAEAVVLARLVEVTPASGIEGFGSTVTFEVLDSMKGRFQQGDTLTVMQASSPQMTVEGEFVAEDSGEFLLQVSPSRYEAFTGVRAGPRSNRTLVQFSPYKIVNRRLVGFGFHGPSSGMSMSEYQAAVQ